MTSMKPNCLSRITLQNKLPMLIAAAFIAPGTLHGQQSAVPGAATIDEETATAPRRYTVELIIFEYTDRAASSEVFLPDPIPEPMSDDGLPIGSSAEIDPANVLDAARNSNRPMVNADAGVDANDRAAIPDIAETELILLPTDEYQLGEIYSKLRRLDAYRPIMHVGWTQVALDNELSLPIELPRLGAPPPRLDGSVRLYLSRFLHLVIDLSLEADASQQMQASDRQPRQFGDEGSMTDRDSVDRRFGDERARAGRDSIDQLQPIYYRINEDRIVRNGEIRYFDHPRIGVIARTSRFEAETLDQAN